MGYPFTSGGAVVILVLALLGWVPWLGWLWWAIAQAYVLPIVRRTAAEGETASSMPTPADVVRSPRFVGDWLGALAMALLATSPLGMVIALTALAAVAPESRSFSQPILPILILLPVVFLFYPLLLASLARTDSALHALLPGMLRRTRRAVWVSLTAASMTALGSVFVVLAATVALDGLGEVRGFLVRALIAYLHFLIAHLTGKALRGVPLRDDARR